MRPPRLLFVFLAVTLGRAAEPAFPFAEATIDELQARMNAGTLTSRELTAAYLNRIAQIDKVGPKLNAVLELNPDALTIAETLDAERKAGRVRGPLHGIPVLIKDSIATADRMETTAGSLALVGAKPPRDAHLVMRLREAGAVILGKTNLSEWANFRGERSVNGWSGRGGQTHNPYALDRSPAGSSSGSGAAVSANLCVAAVGTETFGSLIAPSSACGVVGVKPTVGLVSRAGIIPITTTFDTAGPMARTVRDAAIVLGALAGADARDVATQVRPNELPVDFAGALETGALKGARIGVVRAPNYRPNLDGVFETALSTLRAAGAEVIEDGGFPALTGPPAKLLEVMLYELKEGLNAYLAELGPNVRMKTMVDLIKFNDAHWAQEQPLFGQQYFTRAQAKGPLTEQAYLDARATCRRLMRTDGIDAVMDKHHLDALVTVAIGPPNLIAPGGRADPIFGAGAPSGFGFGAAAVAGYPSVTVPAAEIAGLPVGLLFYGRAWSEAKLLALAADFESRTHARREPQFLPTAENR
jgi:amidase